MRPAPRVPPHLRTILETTGHPRALLGTLKMLPLEFRVQRLGVGAYRTGYRVSCFGNRRQELVVKRRQDKLQKDWDGPVGRQCSKSSRIRYAPTVKIGNWDVQHFYIPIPDCFPGFDWLYRLKGDIKESNCGLEKDGTVVAFDW